ncbi:hypothetical protein RCL_jg18335.t1 [Rhizophagus clarus]|uniref:Uncharacterized protein n=1 Tax=Rhizophagus clarus TaxID=94130 RepID=A0A8H3QRB9_9GLOM|nr:hypothetical protein RCL_jg18335.t1 [Rhizophagus clarus]
MGGIVTRVMMQVVNFSEQELKLVETYYDKTKKRKNLPLLSPFILIHASIFGDPHYWNYDSELRQKID